MKGSKEETRTCSEKAASASFCLRDSGALSRRSLAKQLLESSVESELKKEIYSLMLFFGELSSSQESRSGGNSWDSRISSLQSLLSNGVIEILRAPESFQETLACVASVSAWQLSWSLCAFCCESRIFLACISSSSSCWSIMTKCCPLAADIALCLAKGGDVHDEREAGFVERSPLVFRLSHRTRFPLVQLSNLLMSGLSNDLFGDDYIGDGELAVLPSAC